MDGHAINYSKDYSSLIGFKEKEGISEQGVPQPFTEEANQTGLKVSVNSKKRYLSLGNKLGKTTGKAIYVEAWAFECVSFQ